MKKLFYYMCLSIVLLFGMTSCDNSNKTDDVGKIEVIDFKANKEFYQNDEKIDFVVNVKNNEQYDISGITIDNNYFPVTVNSRKTRLECNNSGLRFSGEQRFTLSNIVYKANGEEKTLKVEGQNVLLKPLKQSEKHFKLSNVSLEGLKEGIYFLNKGTNLKLNFNLSYAGNLNIGKNDYHLTGIEVKLTDKDTSENYTFPYVLGAGTQINNNNLEISTSVNLNNNGDAMKILKLKHNYTASIVGVKYTLGAKTETSHKIEENTVSFKTSDSGVSYMNSKLVKVNENGILNAYKNKFKQYIITTGDTIKVKITASPTSKNTNIEEIRIKDSNNNEITVKNGIVTTGLTSEFSFKYQNTSNKKQIINFEITELKTSSGIKLQFSEGEMKIQEEFVYYPNVIKTEKNINDNILTKDTIFVENATLNTLNTTLFNGKKLTSNIDFNGCSLVVKNLNNKAMFSVIDQNASLVNLDLKIFNNAFGNSTICEENYGLINNVSLTLRTGLSTNGFVVKENNGTLTNIELKVRVTSENTSANLSLICLNNTNLISNVVVNEFETNIKNKTFVLYLDAINNTGTIKNLVFNNIDSNFTANRYISSVKQDDKKTYTFLINKRTLEGEKLKEHNVYLYAINVFEKENVYVHSLIYIDPTIDKTLITSLQKLGFNRDNKTKFWEIGMGGINIIF